MTRLRTLPPVWLLMTALIIAEITSTFESGMAFAALPTLIHHFGDAAAVSWTLTIFFVVSAGTAPLFARLGDLYGRRRILILVLAVAATGSLISGLSTSLEGVILGRTLQGFTGAVLPLCLGLMRENLDPKSLPFNIGVMGGVIGVSAGLAYLVAGLIIDSINWHTMFLFSAALAVTGIIAVWLIVPPSPKATQSGRLDIAGGVMFAPAIGGLLLAMTYAKTGWLQWHSGGLLLGSLALLAVWVRHELRHATPLMDLRLFADRRILLANLIYAAVAMGPMVNPQIILTLAQQPLWTGIGLGLTATAAALLKQPTTFMGFVAGPIGGFISQRHGSRAAAVIACAALAGGWVLPLLITPSLPVLLAAVSLYSFGVVMIFGAVGNLIVEAAPADRTSEAMGLAQVTRSTFNAIGSQVVVIVLATSVISNPELDTRSHPDHTAYLLAFGYLTVTSLLALLAAWLLPRPTAEELAAPRVAVGH